MIREFWPTTDHKIAAMLRAAGLKEIYTSLTLTKRNHLDWIAVFDKESAREIMARLDQGELKLDQAELEREEQELLHQAKSALDRYTASN